MEFMNLAFRLVIRCNNIDDSDAQERKYFDKKKFASYLITEGGFRDEKSPVTTMFVVYLINQPLRYSIAFDIFLILFFY